MVVPKPNLSPESRSAVREISDQCSNAHQAKGVLRSYILTSLIKLRTREQIYFLKNCIDKDLTTPRIWKITENLGLQRKQGEILRKTMMKNLRRELYQKLSKLTREQTERERTLRGMVREEDFVILRRQERAEQDYARPKLRKHYQDRINWIKKKSEEKRRSMVPREVDGIIMEDIELGEEFETKIRQYGGVRIDEDEREALKMQPNFAVYEEVDEMDFMANTEKNLQFVKVEQNQRGEQERHTDK